MQWPAATLMTGLTCGYWTYAIVGGQLFAITGNVFLFWLISKISRADDRREREAFLLNGVGGVVLNRYILAPRPLYRSARTVVTAAKDLWTGRNVALKMTEDRSTFKTEIDVRFGPQMKHKVAFTHSVPPCSAFALSLLHLRFIFVQNSKDGDAPTQRLDPRYVVPLEAWHNYQGIMPAMIKSPSQNEGLDNNLSSRLPSALDLMSPAADLKTVFVLVMPLGQRTLRDVTTHTVALESLYLSSSPSVQPFLSSWLP